MPYCEPAGDERILQGNVRISHNVPRRAPEPFEAFSSSLARCGGRRAHRCTSGNLRSDKPCAACSSRATSGCRRREGRRSAPQGARGRRAGAGGAAQFPHHLFDDKLDVAGVALVPQDAHVFQADERSQDLTRVGDDEGALCFLAHTSNFEAYAFPLKRKRFPVTHIRVICRAEVCPPPTSRARQIARGSY